MDKRGERALNAHHLLNIYQVEMKTLKQSSELVNGMLYATPPLGTTKPTIKVKDENILYRIQQFPLTETVGVMNFANPFVPGGHFQEGINAQEQALCRNTFLYPELKKFVHNFYEENLKNPHFHLYANSLIYSHHIKVLRDEKENRILPYFHYIDIVTVAAPNLTLVPQDHQVAAEIFANLLEKIINTLRAFKNNRIRSLILGAFGCGVFQNDPKLVALAFKQALSREEFLGSFETIYFDILNNQPVLEVFKKCL